MIGQPEWFKYRTFGWGLSPKTWQGWVYLGVFALLLGFVTAVTFNSAIKLWVYAILLGVLMLDVIHIMTKMDKVMDERENYHQLIIERNCSFAAIVALSGVAIYQAYQNRALLESGAIKLPFDYSILIVLGVMLFTKIASTAYVKTKK